MPKLVDLTGRRFARLTVIKRVDNDKNKNRRWLCLCDCGQKTVVISSNLTKGNTKSCGCLHREGNNTKHGHGKKNQESKTYISWHQMIQRCTNANNPRYEDYGGRDIKVCQRWFTFANFLEDMGEQPLKHQIDRIDNDGNYCKENCRWTTPKINSRNKRNNNLLLCFGRIQCLAAWSEEIGIHPKTIHSRLTRGWSVYKTITTPVRENK